MEGLSVNTRMMRTAVLLALCLWAGEAFTLAPRAASRAVHGPLRPLRSANDAMDALDQLLRENEEKLDESCRPERLTRQIQTRMPGEERTQIRW